MISIEIEEYCEDHSGKNADLLNDLFRETHLKTVYSRMISGKLQGKFLRMISSLMNPNRILEIGTFTGYSALCLAQGLKKDGELITIDNNPEVTWLAEKYFKKSHFADNIELINGAAIEILPKLNPTFDIIFLDADKENYPLYYKECIRLLDKNGVLIADNVLWGLKPLDPPGTHHDKETLGIIKFNEMVKEDSSVEKVMLPFRDGVFLIKKVRA